jgi:uncharacterized protein VirK/YbjX
MNTDSSSALEGVKSLSLPQVQSARGGLYLRLFRELWDISPRVLAKPNSYSTWARLKFTLRGTLHGRWMESWLDFLRRPEIRSFAGMQPLLYLRIQWPYISRNFDVGRRVHIIQNHYRFVSERFSGALTSILCSRNSLLLARWSLPPLGNFVLRLFQVHKFGQEGEMIVSLDHEDTGRRFAFLHFSISADSEGQPEIYIGCLQGGKPDEAIAQKELVASFTQLMHGSRPKNLVIFALRRIAKALSIDRIRAVSTELHVFRSELRTDYNIFWPRLSAAKAGLPPSRLTDFTPQW